MPNSEDTGGEENVESMKKKKYALLLLMSMILVLWTSCDKANGSDEPTPEEEYVVPKTHIYSDDSSTEAAVKEVRSDGTVVLDASTAKDIPEEGEIIVSSVTDAAPEGFLYHVENVQQSDREIVIKTSPATLNEVLPDAHIEQPLTFSEVSQSSNSNPVVMQSNGIRRPKGDFDLLHLKYTFNVFEKPGGTVDVFGVNCEEYIKATVPVDLKIGGTFIYDGHKLHPDRVGIILKGSLSVSAEVEAALKAAYEKKFAETPLKPIVFLVGAVPVVIVPCVQWHIGLLDSNGKVYAKWKPVDIKALGFDARFIWNKEADANGNNWERGFTPNSDIAENSWQDYLKGMANFEVGLKGEVRWSVWPEMRFKLYNTDAVSLAIGIAPYAKLNGELAVKYQLDSYSWDDFEIKDNLSLSLGINIPLEGKTEFNVFGKKIGGELSDGINLYEKPIVEAATFFPVFNDFRLTPEDNAKTSEFVHVSSKKGGTAASLFYAWESDFGYCYSQIKKDANGNELPRDWRYISLKSTYPGSPLEQKIEADIPTANLVENATYEVRPYWSMQFGSLKQTWVRKGDKFKTGGMSSEGNGAVVPDVSGYRL